MCVALVCVFVYFQLLSCVLLFATLWTIALQTPLSVGFPTEEYWNGLPFPPSGSLPDPGIEPMFPVLQVDFHC